MAKKPPPFVKKGDNDKGGKKGAPFGGKKAAPFNHRPPPRKGK